MRKTVAQIVVLLVGVGAGLLLSGCSTTRIRQISAEDFVRRRECGKYISSFHWTTYVGVSWNRAYLEYGEAPVPWAPRGRTTVLWVPLSELPEELASELRAKSGLRVIERPSESGEKEAKHIELK